MNIVFLSRLFYPHVGGVEKHVLRLSETLINQGHSITVITEQYDKSLPLRDSHNKINIIRIPVSNTSEGQKKLVIWKWFWSNQDVLNKADVIHVHDVVFWLYIWKLFHPSKQIFTTFHGWEGIFPIPKKNILQRRLDAWLSAKNICVGEFICKHYGISANEITYGAVDQVKEISSTSKNTLLFLGRLSADTGFENCLETYKLLKPKYKWNLVIVGDGPLKNSIPSDAQYKGVLENPEKEIGAAKYVYTTGYLGILESFIQEKIVLSSFNNPVKKDYLLMHPMAKYLNFGDEFPNSLSKVAIDWAKDQTWDKLGIQYKNLWSKSQS